MRFRSPFKVLDLKEEFGQLTFGTFVERLNRFVVLLLVNGELKKAHLSDTGRLRELLVEGAPLLLAPNPRGKLDYKVVAVKSGGEWVLINTQVHPKIAQGLIEAGCLGFKPKEILREVKRGRSRIDFLIDGDFYLEVKGCNLVKEGVCLFPDAPTERGRKHLEELIRLKREGFRAGVLFLAFRSCFSLRPNAETDSAFAEVFSEAKLSGVDFFAFRLVLKPLSGEVWAVEEIPV
ncbi:sugar fermentation stimulation protein [Thermovibrio ammonificans HB-1]|uniref:Sugar fermentation stimulation protein homolog n=1 Tax=Thermovibrio ammonificans (strain DSM 15698 / JCM 12110 / HB-1) TaxID=648996 RepID=E8T3P7_THEA1|nr:DNA/RNA nuclease SfsA [Thermovibrio ammonificans]ADU97304.1 sugar fermentation stimulation protein [Thermovibrio ammonificans HB-1]